MEVTPWVFNNYLCTEHNFKAYITCQFRSGDDRDDELREKHHCSKEAILKSKLQLLIGYTCFLHTLPTFNILVD